VAEQNVLWSAERRTRYLTLWVLALALGWFEASVVVYLRELYCPTGFQFPVPLMPARLVAVEVTREALSIVLLGAAACLATRRVAGRIGAFLLLFGVWDLTYYAVLKLVLGWPEAWGDWDILFLIPLPWVGPVWAPSMVAALFVAAGSYLFWTSDRARRYRRVDAAVLLASGAAIVATFLAGWRIVPSQEVPRGFAAVPFWAAVLGGTAWFVHAERRRSGLTNRDDSACTATGARVT
jgi:hypothetical protein